MGHRKGDPRPEQVPDIEPDELEEMIVAASGLVKQPKCDMTNPDAVAERYDWYVQYCIDNNLRPGVASLASAFGYSRDRLLEIKNGQSKSIPQESSDMLKRIWGMFETLMEQYMMTGKLNPVTGIFMMKNHFGYKDQTERVIVKQDPYESGNPEEIARKYLSGVAPALDAPQENAPIVETVVIDQTGTVE